MPQLQTIDLFLSISVGLRQEIYQGDLEEAFLQGKAIKRLVSARQPQEGVPGLHFGQLLRMGKEAYGTVRAPASWRETLIEHLIHELGYAMCPNDPCVFILRDVTPLSKVRSAVARAPSRSASGWGRRLR